MDAPCESEQLSVPLSDAAAMAVHLSMASIVTVHCIRVCTGQAPGLTEFRELR
jgi:hypothetical protein